MEKMTKDKHQLERYLKAQGWLQVGEEITNIEIPGAGNMNFTLRITTPDRSFIVKQSRDYVEKYPQVAAPVERALREAEFYGLVSGYPQLKKQMPELLGVDKKNHVLYLEDLGHGVDFTYLYQQGKSLKETELEQLICFPATLHTTVNTNATAARLPNREMRKLNHEHIFIYPYLKKNGLNLDDILPGFQEISDDFKADQTLKNRVKQLGKRYLVDGEILLHGDYFPGSWLKTKDGIKIIDPEFCFFGEPEFEIGIILAHLKMASQSEGLIKKALKIYKNRAPLNEDLCFQFMAVEMLRRLVGLAQLPLTLDLETRTVLLKESRGILV